MPEEYPYKKLAWYPHMMPEDVAVWERYIDKFPEAFDTCMYDFPVGTVPDFVLNDKAVDAKTMERLYKKKIDVVARKGSRLVLIELKPICTNSTIGQIMGYQHLYVREIGDTPYPYTAVICGEANGDTRDFAHAQAVDVYVV